MVSIDIIVPSYRLQHKYLNAIAGLAAPEDVQTRLLIIADNPDIPVPDELSECIDDKRTILIRNKENLGASASRNAGIEHSTADWMLFLDDDIIPSDHLLFAYADAIRNHPSAPGFFGETVFPEPVNSFTRGTVIGDMLYFFSYAGNYDETICTTTSNVLVNRAAVGAIRFRDSFPKKGGGEDFAFFKELYNYTGKTLKSVKEAPVFHGWWHGGKRNYSQFIRWSYADHELFRLFPETVYRSFPNVVEAFFIAFLVGLGTWVFAGSPVMMFSLLSGILLGELLVVFYFLLKGKGLKASIYAPEVMLVRAAADLGRLQGILATMRFADILKRPNFSGMKVTRHFHFWPAVKFTAYILITILIYTLVKYYTHCTLK